MKAPDKIYINGFSAFATVPVKEGIEYIRKDALLEWVKQKQYDSETIVQDDFWQEVMDKLNEM